jgi:hypothetical protein
MLASGHAPTTQKTQLISINKKVPNTPLASIVLYELLYGVITNPNATIIQEPQAACASSRYYKVLAHSAGCMWSRQYYRRRYVMGDLKWAEPYVTTPYIINYFTRSKSFFNLPHFLIKNNYN